MDDDERAKLNEIGRQIERNVANLLPPDFVSPGTHYDRDGVPIGLGDWTALFDDWDYRLVALTHIGGHRISTVWLGLNHSIVGPPTIFETMVAAENPDDTDHRWWDLQARYSTEAQALDGHEAIVRHVETVTGQKRTPHA